MTTITVDIQEQDGTFYATSEEVPGFFLASNDKAGLHADILPTMKALLAIREKFSKKVTSNKVSKRIVERVELIAA